jgi:hypothetical protein
MSGRPATVSAPASALDTIHQRLAEFLGEMPAPTRSLLAATLLPAAENPDAAAPGVSGAEASTCRNDFYWLLIPEWLAGARDESLDDILWGQYCLYCVFRAQDDVVDGDADDPHLAVAANVFAMEAFRALSRHLDPTSGFWDGYRESMATTSHALIAIDRRQSTPVRDGRSDPHDYAALSRCLTVATQAVVTLTEHVADWPRFSTLLDHLAIAGQILDDFHDMRSDLAGGRYNHAAWLMTRPVFGGTAEATEAIIASNLATTDRLSEVFGAIERHIVAAESLVVHGDPPELAGYLGRFRRTVDGLRRSVAARQRRLFPGCRAQSGPSSASYTAPTTGRLDWEPTVDSRMG